MLAILIVFVFFNPYLKDLSLNKCKRDGKKYIFFISSIKYSQPTLSR